MRDGRYVLFLYGTGKLRAVFGNARPFFGCSAVARGLSACSGDNRYFEHASLCAGGSRTAHFCDDCALRQYIRRDYACYRIILAAEPERWRAEKTTAGILVADFYPAARSTHH